MTAFDELNDNICRNAQQKGKGMSKGDGRIHGSSHWGYIYTVRYIRVSLSN